MRRNTLLPLIVLACAIPVAAADGVMRARRLTEKRLPSHVFDERWTLPRQRFTNDELKPPQRVDLLREMKALAGKQFPMKAGERDLAWTRSFGDLIRGLREAKNDPKRRARMLAILRKGRPSVWKVVGDYLPQLVNDDRLYSAEWDPDDDEDDDGLLFVDAFDRTTARKAPWKDLDGTTDVHQAATLVYADLEAIKAAENDFSDGDDYEEFWAIRGSYLRGKDERGSPFAVMRSWFVSDLTFPYGTCSSELRVRTTLDDDGHVRTDMYGTGDDFYWLAGQDVAIPVYASDGQFIAMLVTRAYGLDIRGVPDGDGSRRAAIRDMLGSARLLAERNFAEYGGKPRTVAGKIPAFVVRGVGPAPASQRDD